MASSALDHMKGGVFGKIIVSRFVERIDVMAHACSLSVDDSLAMDLARALTHGDVDGLHLLLDGNPELATCRVDGRTPLHILADAPGHRPNTGPLVSALVAAGADLDAHATEMWHHETPLHWAASNDDVGLIDALLDAGADIEHPGSSINGGSPISSAVGYGQWAAARRLCERGARIETWHAAALGHLSDIERAVEAVPSPSTDELSVWFWNACRAGQPAVARYLLDRGAAPHWAAPWSGETPLEIAAKAGQEEIVSWLHFVLASAENEST
jgi:ankyrin repeat protein